MFYYKKKKKSISLTDDPIIELFLRIAVPSSIGTIFMTLYNVVDTYFAGKISPEALAALAQTFPVYFIIIALGVGLSIGTTALIANSIGKKDFKKSAHYLSQSIIVSILTAFLVALIGINLGPEIIYMMNKNLEILKMSMEYLNIIFLGSIFIFIQMSVNSALTAKGDTISNRNILIFSFFLNIVLNPLFIFGYGIIPAFGIKGIALSTVVSQFLGVIYIIYKLYKTDITNFIKLSFFYPNIKILKDIFGQGVPASIGMMMISLGVFIILFFIGSFGNLAIAGYGTAVRYEQIFLLPILGLNTAVLSMVGQNFGAKKINRIKEIYNKALIIGCTFMFIFSFIIYFTAEISILNFSKNTDVIFYGKTYLQIIAFMLPIYPIFFISNALIQGLKKANIVMILSLVRMVLLPAIIFWFLIVFLNASYEYVFWGVVIINWIFGIIVFIITKYIIFRVN